MRFTHERFDVLRELGHGGMGVVYEATDRVRSETVALKTILRADADAIYRMKREFRALSDLEHPNVVRLYDLFVDGVDCFFTMELVHGVDLERYVRLPDNSANVEVSTQDGEGHRDESAIRYALTGLFRGLEALHGAGLLHRDLKPSNVLVTDRGRVVLLDFGLVADARASIQHTHAGGVVGTVAYMAPEQARGETELTTAVDIYAVGVILYQLLTGKLPIDGPPLRVLAAKQHVEPPRPGSVAPGISPDLDTLAVDMMAIDPAARPTVSEVLTRLGATSPGAHRSVDSSGHREAGGLLGREREQAAMSELLRSTASGRPAIALVRGRSGLGKTALMGAFCRRASQGGAVVLSGRCYERETVPYKGLDGVIDTLSRYLSGAAPEELGRLLPPNLGDLATLFPVLRRIRPIAAAYARRSSTELPVARVRLKGFACLRELLRRIGESEPLVVAIDDVQWSDDDTVAGLLELLRHDDAPPLMLLIGARPDIQSPLLDELGAAALPASLSHCARELFELDPLPLPTVRALVRRDLGVGASESLVESMAAHAQGSPFTVAELVRFMRESHSEGTPFDLDRTIDEVIRIRASNLGAGARSLLETLAVAGEPMPIEPVLRASGLSENDRAPIDLLRTRHFTRTMRQDAGALIDTAHDRFREAIADGIDTNTRRAIHRRIAEALESQEHPPHDKLARHFAAAGVGDLARHHATLAADEAAAALAFRRASDLYAIAIGFAPDTDRCVLLPRLAEAQTAAGRFDDAARSWCDASAVVRGSAARDFERRAAECFLYAGRVDQGLALLDATASELGVRIPRTRLGMVLSILVGRLRLLLQGSTVRIREAKEIPAKELERLRILGAVVSAYLPIDQVGGLSIHSRYLYRARALGDPQELALALAYEISLLSMGGRHRQAETARRQLERVTQVGTTGWVKHVSHISTAISSVFTGDLGVALEAAERAVDRLRLSNAPAWTVSLAYYALGLANGSRLSTEVGQDVERYVVERSEEAGPFAEIHIKSNGLALHWLRVGRLDRLHALGTDEFWHGVTARPLFAKTVAFAFDSTAFLIEGDVRAALRQALKARSESAGSMAEKTAVMRGLVGRPLAAAAVANGDIALARRCVGAVRASASDRLGRQFELHTDATASLVESDRTKTLAALERMRVHAASICNELGEATACWALGRLMRGPEAETHRLRAEEMIGPSGIVDPDRYLWAFMPIGGAPPCTGGRALVWPEDVR